MQAEIKRREESLRSKQEALGARKKQFEEQKRVAREYKKAEAERAQARKAVDEERERTEREPASEAVKLTNRIEKLRKDSSVLLGNALKEARLFGQNPHPGEKAAQLRRIQQKVVYHTTADWDDRTLEEVEGAAQPKMKQWLKRVRGY
jgi:hypothetical protein